MTAAEPEPGVIPETPERHSQPALPSRSTVWAVFLAAVAMAVLCPAIDTLVWVMSPPSHGFVRHESVLEMLPMVGAGSLIAIWLFVFWSLIGSFLNVVVHRLPLGESVVHGGSHCPRCSSPIKWHDNLPVVGWLRLKGRCRSCDLPIAARYPVVEAICAGVGTAVYFRELLSGGANLPQRTPDFLHSGVLRLVPNASPDLIGLYLYHCCTLCVLLVWGLIAWDGRQLPGRSAVRVLLVAVGLPLLFPSLHPLALGWQPGRGEHLATPAWLLNGLGVSLAGGLAGLLCGLVLNRLFGRLLRGDAAGRSGLPLRPPQTLGLGLMLVGIVFGWQGMLGTTVLLLVACLVQMLVWSAVMDWPEMPTELVLVAATFVHLCLWRQLTTSLGPWWPGVSPTLACLAPAVAMVLAVSLALVAITPASHRPTSPGAADLDHRGDQPA